VPVATCLLSLGASALTFRWLPKLQFESAALTRPLRLDPDPDVQLKPHSAGRRVPLPCSPTHQSTDVPSQADCFAVGSLVCSNPAVQTGLQWSDQTRCGVIRTSIANLLPLP